MFINSRSVTVNALLPGVLYCINHLRVVIESFVTKWWFNNGLLRLISKINRASL